MAYSKHGGSCCGMVHLHDLYDYVDENDRPSFDALSKGCQAAVNLQGGKGCVEAVITGSMLKDWRRKLDKLGFRRVNSFVNGNSGNTCYVYHLLTNQPEKKKG